MPWLLILIGGALTVVAIKSLMSPADLPTDVRGALLAKMNALVGTPYIWGGRDPSKGLDCSGAVDYVMVACGFAPRAFLGNTADNLYHLCKSVPAPIVMAGDLAFYGSPSHVSHVMMCIGDGRTIGASGGGPSTTTVEIANAQGARVKIQPATYRTGDLVGFGRLPIA